MKGKNLALTVTVIAGLALIAWVVLARRADSAAVVHLTAPQYRCPMHPEYVATKPGTCPACGMLLVAATPQLSPAKTLAGPQERVAVRIQPGQQRVMGLSLAEVRKVPFERILRAAGHVSMAPVQRFTAYHPGVIAEVNRPVGPLGAVRLRAAEPILSMSSPDIEAPRKTIFAPTPLVLLSVPRPGQRMAKGNELYTYIDLSTMLVLADIRSSDIAYVKPGLRAEARLPSHPGKVWRGKVVESSQQFDEQTQTLKVKLEFPNDAPDIWQGMLASLDLHCPVQRLLAIPDSAAIASGEETIVFVAGSANVFEPRSIVPGLRANSWVEVKSGLSPGDRVVTSSTFLLDSESRLKAVAQVREGH